MSNLVASASQDAVNAQMFINRAVFEVNRTDRAGDPDVMRVHLIDAVNAIGSALSYLTPYEHKRRAAGKPPARRKKAGAA